MKNIKNLTVQQWIPIDKIYNDGIIKLKENKLIKILKININKIFIILFINLINFIKL